MCFQKYLKEANTNHMQVQKNDFGIFTLSYGNVKNNSHRKLFLILLLKSFQNSQFTTLPLIDSLYGAKSLSFVL